MQVNPIIYFHVTHSPWTHTHVASLHKLAHPVSQKVPLEGEGKDSRVAKGSWGAGDGVESTPRRVLEQPFYPSFWTLASALCMPAGPCPNKKSRNSAAQHSRHTSSAAVSNWQPHTPTAATVTGGSEGGTLLKMRGICKGRGACCLEVRICALRGHPVASVTAAEASALARSRRASAAKRENLLCRG